MVKWIEIRDVYGSTFVLNVAALIGYKHYYDTNNYEYNCNGSTYLVDQDMHDKIMDAVDEYCEEFEALLKKENSVAPVTNNITTGLNATQVKLQILNCDFLDAEQKLKLIISLNI